MSEGSYVPVSDRPSSDFGNSLLDVSGASKPSASPFPTSSFTPNQRSNMGMQGFSLADWISENVIYGGKAKVIAGAVAFVIFLVVIIEASKGSSGDSANGGGGNHRHNNHARIKVRLKREKRAEGGVVASGCGSSYFACHGVIVYLCISLLFYF